MADRVTSSAPQEKSWSAINNIKCQTDRTKALAATKYRKLEISGFPRTIQTGYSAKALFLCICQFWKPKRTNFKLNFSDPKPVFLTRWHSLPTSILFFSTPRAQNISFMKNVPLCGHPYGVNRACSQCDQTWQNFTTLANNWKSLATYLRFI